MTLRTKIYFITAFLEAIVYLGLAVYIVVQRPRRSISWVFGSFSAVVAILFLTGLFLYSGPGVIVNGTPFPLRLKWAVGSFSPILLFHFTWFFWSPGWQKFWVKTLPFGYLLSVVFAGVALFTDWLVSGPRYYLHTQIFAPTPGPLMPILLFYSASGLVVGLVGLIANYRLSQFPSIRRQIGYVLIPFVLIVATGVADWLLVLTRTETIMPHEVSNILLLATAFFFGKATIRYGVFVDLPQPRHNLLVAFLTIASALSAFYLAMMADRWLSIYTLFPLPILTSLLVILVAIGFTTRYSIFIRQLGNWLFPTKNQQRQIIDKIGLMLAELPEPGQLQQELLNTLCQTLHVSSGFIAMSDANQAATVQVIFGNSALQVDDIIEMLDLPGQEPQLVTSIASQVQNHPHWRNTAVVCPYDLGQQKNGILALGEKQDESAFTSDELTLLAGLISQFPVVEKIIRLRQEQNRRINEAYEQGPKLQELSQQVLFTAQQSLVKREKDQLLKIRILGMLEVSYNDNLVPEAHWGTEKAKAMLAYLLWKGSVGATREALSTALWPDRSLEEAANVFHVTLHHLRRVLEPKRKRGSQYIIYEGGRYKFNVAAPHWLDAAQFEQILVNGDPKTLQEAVTLYRGDYLEDIAWALPPEVEAERRRLERLYEKALRQLIILDPHSESHLRKLLRITPTDEAANRILVEYYLSLGRSDLAHRHIQHWQDCLQEMALQPSPAAQTLWQSIEKHEFSP